MTFHPLDDPEFRQWCEDNDYIDEHMAYGIYDSRWLELYDLFKEETINEEE